MVKNRLHAASFIDAIEAFANKVNCENPLNAFEQALDNANPTLEVKSGV